MAYLLAKQADTTPSGRWTNRPSSRKGMGRCRRAAVGSADSGGHREAARSDSGAHVHCLWRHRGRIVVSYVAKRLLPCSHVDLNCALLACCARSAQAQLGLRVSQLGWSPPTNSTLTEPTRLDYVVPAWPGVVGACLPALTQLAPVFVRRPTCHCVTTGLLES